MGLLVGLWVFSYLFWLLARMAHGFVLGFLWAKEQQRRARECREWLSKFQRSEREQHEEGITIDV